VEETPERKFAELQVKN